MALPRVAFFKNDFGTYPAIVDTQGNPVEGSRSIRAFIDVSAAVTTVDLGLLLNEEILSNVQAIFIDNSDGLNPVTIESSLTKHRIIIPGGWQYVGPFLFANDQKMEATRADAGTLRVFLFNMPHPVAAWPATNAAASETVVATIADGADVSQGAKADAAVIDPTASASVIALLKGILSVQKSGTATPANVAGSAASVALFVSNPAAEVRTIFNDSAAVLNVNFGAAASAVAFVAQLQPGGYYELPQPLYTGAVNGIWSSAVGSARVMEQSA